MHMRLEELFGEGEWFGSRNMMFVGNLLQLPHVSGSPVFQKISAKTLLFQLECATSLNTVFPRIVPTGTINFRFMDGAGII